MCPFLHCNQKVYLCFKARKHKHFKKQIHEKANRVYLPDNSHHPSSSIRSHRNVIAALLNPNVHDSPVKEVQWPGGRYSCHRDLLFSSEMFFCPPAKQLWLYVAVLWEAEHPLFCSAVLYFTTEIGLCTPKYNDEASIFFFFCPITNVVSMCV